MSRSAVILCGGTSSRMGRDKACLPVDGIPMLVRVVRVLLPIVDRAVVVAAQGQTLPDLPNDVFVVRDDLPAQGPLAGLSVGLRALQAGDHVFVASCDIPYLRPELVHALFDALGEADAAMPDIEGRLHPLTAVYHARVAGRAEELLKLGCRRMLDLCNSIQVRRVSRAEIVEADPDLRSLVNVNTLQDLDLR